MKRNIPVIVFASAVSIMAVGAVAQNAPQATIPGQDARGGNTPMAQGQHHTNDAVSANAPWMNTAPASADPAQSAQDREELTRTQPSRHSDLADKDADKDADKKAYKKDGKKDAQTARHVRDQDDQTRKPLVQGNSRADRETTAQIRKEIIAGENMSMNAQNVKIITRDGQVTLRGPVNSAEEKRAIGEIAVRITNEKAVDNQLEITGPSVSSIN